MGYRRRHTDHRCDIPMFTSVLSGIIVQVLYYSSFLSSIDGIGSFSCAIDAGRASSYLCVIERAQEPSRAVTDHNGSSNSWLHDYGSSSQTLHNILRMEYPRKIGNCFLSPIHTRNVRSMSCSYSSSAFGSHFS